MQYKGPRKPNVNAIFIAKNADSGPEGILRLSATSISPLSSRRNVQGLTMPIKISEQKTYLDTDSQYFYGTPLDIMSNLITEEEADHFKFALSRYQMDGLLAYVLSKRDEFSEKHIDFFKRMTEHERTDKLTIKADEIFYLDQKICDLADEAMGMVLGKGLGNHYFIVHMDPDSGPDSPSIKQLSSYYPEPLVIGIQKDKQYYSNKRPRSADRVTKLELPMIEPIRRLQSP